MTPEDQQRIERRIADMEANAVSADWNRNIPFVAESCREEQAAADAIRRLLAAYQREHHLATIYGDAVAEWRPIVEEVGQLRADLQRVTQERDEARAFIVDLEKHDCERWRNEGLGCAICHRMR